MLPPFYNAGKSLREVRKISKKVYQDKDWLYKQYIIENKSARKIGKEIGVSDNCILRYIRKFGIKKTKEKEKESRIEGLTVERVSLNCGQCGKLFEVRKRLYENKRAGGQSNFYCGKQCAGKSLSRKRTGIPNTKHPFNKNHPDHALYIKKISENGKKLIEKYKEDGSWDWRLKRLQDGHASFIKTEEGRKALYKAGVRAVKSQRGKSTSIEIKMRNELKRRSINFVEQYVVGNRYVADFYLPEYNIIIECDGDYWHTRPEVMEKDIRKNSFIKKQGYSLYRFWESEINECIESCVDIVFTEVNNKEDAS